MANVLKGTIKLDLKHDDRASFEYHTPDGIVLIEAADGVPYVGILGGDYTRLKIDNETGRIIGWKPITSEEFENGDDDDEG